MSEKQAAVVACNCTTETKDLLEAAFTKSSKFINFHKENKINLSNQTYLLRLALLHMYNTPPSHAAFTEYRYALSSPDRFDDFWMELPKGEEE